MTPKQERFVGEYLKDLNATQAAIRAGYSKKTAEVQGPRLLGNVRVAAKIKEAQEKLAEETGITVRRTLEELALIGFADMGTYLRFEPNGDVFLDWTALPEGATKVISEITQEVVKKLGEGEDAAAVIRTKFKLHDKLSALDKIGRHLGMFKDRVEHTGKDGGPIETTQKLPPAVQGILDRISAGADQA